MQDLTAGHPAELTPTDQRPAAGGDGSPAAHTAPGSPPGPGHDLGIPESAAIPELPEPPEVAPPAPSRDTTRRTVVPPGWTSGAARTAAAFRRPS